MLRLAVADQRAVVHGERIAGKSHKALHEILGEVLRPLKHDDVAVRRMPDSGKALTGKRNFRAIHQLVHEEKIADEQCAFHAAAGDLVRLYEKCANDQKEQDCQGKRLGPLEEAARDGYQRAAAGWSPEPRIRDCGSQ